MGTKYTIVVINAYFHLILNVKKEGSMRSRVMWVVKVLTWGIKISYDDIKLDQLLLKWLGRYGNKIHHCGNYFFLSKNVL